MGTSACSGGQGQAWQGEQGSHTAQGDRKGPRGLAGHSLGGVCARAGLQAAGDCLCCGIAGAGADSPLGLLWGPGPWGDAGQEELLLPAEP